MISYSNHTQGHTEILTLSLSPLMDAYLFLRTQRWSLAWAEPQLAQTRCDIPKMAAENQAPQRRVLSNTEEDAAARVQPPGCAGSSTEKHHFLNNGPKLSPDSQRDSNTRREIGADTQGHYKLQNWLDSLLLGDAKRVRAQGRSSFWSLRVGFTWTEISCQAEHGFLQAQQQQ